MVTFTADQIEKFHPARGEAIVYGLTGSDLRDIGASRFSGAQVEVEFEGDPIPYRWTTVQILDDRARAPRFVGSIERAEDIMPLVEKQRVLAKGINDRIIPLGVKPPGGSLPSLVAIPAGEEDGSYVETSPGVWTWTP